MEKQLGHKQMVTDFSQYGFYEYLLMVHPDAAVNEQLIAEKEAFSAKYKTAVAIKTKPHIAVANFLARETMEDTLIRWIQRACSLQHNFNVTLNNYSGFPKHTVFWRVQDHLPFKDLCDSLKVIQQYLTMNECPDMKLTGYRPHVTLARRLPEHIYFNAMLDYSQQVFHASFEVNELVLLRRKHQFDTCEQVNVFGLKRAMIETED
jgi:2'-5' RNA ligase